ncbi:MAG: DUF5658 family protein [Microthrixaceae bacterium]
MGEHLGHRGHPGAVAVGHGRLVSLPLLDLRVPVSRCYLALSLVLLNVVDVVLTKAVLERGGVEANPLMQDLMAGFAAPIGLKAAIAGVAGVLLLLCPAESRLATRAVATVAGLYLAIVVWNASLLGYLLVTGA